jgi:DNA-binding transcriptional LysR family regulator
VIAIPLSTQPLMFVCRPDHLLAGRTLVTLASLAEHDFVGPVGAGNSVIALTWCLVLDERRSG